MPIVINGSGTVTGINVGGLPDGIVDTDMIANNAVTSAKATGLGGITVCDHWFFESNASSGTNGILGDSGGAGGGPWNKRSSSTASVTTVTTGSGGGRFSFPTTGMYLITGSFQTYHNTNDNDMGISATITSDNFTNTEILGYIRNTFNASGTPNAYHQGSASFIFDVTDTSNCKFYWNQGSVATNNYVVGANASGNGPILTTCIIMRLGDT